MSRDGTQFRIRVPNKVKLWLDKEAELNHRTLGGQVSFVVESYMKIIETKKAVEGALESASTASSTN